MSTPSRIWLYAPLGWLLHGLALLPFPVLYLLSEIIFFLLYYIVRYRRKVVIDNLVKSFPDRSLAECRKIERQFFRNFADYFFETIKLAHISNDEMRRRMVYENAQIVDTLFDRGRSMVCYFSHCFNWEWAPAITLWTRHKPSPDFIFSQVYRPLVNKWFDNFFLSLRSRFGSVSYPKRTVFRDLVKQQRSGALGICGFMSDQKPSHGDPTHIIRFLNHPTAMITGTEALARRLDMAVVYMDMHKISRGHYKMVMRLITDSPQSLPEMAITERYTQMLQQTIDRNPSLWLWSHKRWKIPVTLPSDEQQHSPSNSHNTQLER